MVEAQHRNATRRLVDSDAEQELLESLIDRVKPPAPTGPEFQGLHYLFLTPFRHPPLPHGSRFGTRAERSLLYASEALETAMAETAYYRLLFLEGSEAPLSPLTVELSAFRADVRTRAAVDLTRPPFDVHRRVLSSRSRYEATQRLGAEMRADGVEVVRYPSARDAAGAPNVALFSPRALARRSPRAPETWRCVASRERVEMQKLDWFERSRLVFPRSQFEVGGALPAPAV
ncbi:MAG TPA: RES family NAD+ phosphorylase [Myxococcaceae bacterium]|nr:RES family NAD+ phosphorylase [Myxococcaceae bacterium]